MTAVDAVDQSDSAGSVTADKVGAGGRWPLTGAFGSIGAKGSAGPGHDADPDLRLAELRVLAGDDHVARHRKLVPAAERVAPNRRDERLADPPDRLPPAERVRGGQGRRRR
jgi:hypothetical protein